MYSKKQNSVSQAGTLSKIIGDKDWSTTAIGPIETWPLSLRSTLGIMLNSKFPMLLFWGHELTCFYNDACYKGMGISGKHADILGKSGAEVLPEIWHIILPIIDKLHLTTEASWHEDQWLPIIRNGKLEDTYWTSSYSPVNDESGKFEGILVTLNDVTEKVEAHKKMEDAEERSRLAAEIAEIATWDLDLQTHEMIHSESLANIFGHKKDVKLTNADVMSQIHPDDLANVVEKAFELAMQTRIYKYEARITKKNGEPGWIRSHGKIFFDANNEPLKIVGTLIDITEERNRSEILMENELKFRLLADSMPQLIWTADPFGNLNYYNGSVFTYAGLSRFHGEKGEWLGLVHSKESEEYVHEWRNAMATGNDFLLEHRLRKHDGQYRWHLSRAIAQKDSDGKIQMWVGTSTDIQQQKTFTDELEKQVRKRTLELKNNNIELIKMNIELQSFVYVSSHDLQEPLRKIQTFISRIYDSEEIKLPKNTTVYFDRINEAAKRMQSLIQDLLAYSRTNLADNVFVLTDLQMLAEQVREDYSEIIRETNATVEISGLFALKVITFQFRQLLNNLIGNALKFTRPGVTPQVIITGNRIKGQDIKNLGLNPKLTYCHISIADNGIGFSMEYSDKIFEVFQRLHSKEEYSGTGIGLAIVKKIVDNHKGIIVGSSIANKGAIFNIYIPEI
ncbi:MAG: PAS domain-containing protein [Flavobacterium sp.]|nr:PAS domain-containing protein [Flavobacterium sp.]